MKRNDKIFHLEFNRWLLEIKTGPEKEHFYVHFLNEVADLIIKRITALNGIITWESQSEGMEDMAQKIGALIEEQFAA